MQCQQISGVDTDYQFPNDICYNYTPMQIKFYTLLTKYTWMNYCKL